MRASHKLSVACIATALGALAPSTAQAGTGKVVAGPPHTLELKVVFTDAHLGGPPQPWTQEEVDTWKPLFEAASRALWDATEKQLAIGKVTTFFDCPAQLDDADIIVDRSNGNISAHRLGLGRSGRNVTFTNRFKDPAQGGATAMVHELGHYLFGLYDEYEGEVVYTSVPKDLPRIHMDDIPLVPGTSAYRYHFCETMTEGGDSATLMDASNKHGLQRTEFCTAHDHATGSGHQRGYVLEPTLMVNGFEMGGVYQTEQQVKAGLSGWEHIAAVTETKLGIKLVVPDGKPVGDGGGVPSLQWDAGSCLPKVVLVIDRSGSMDGSAKMAQAKATATQVAATISDGAMLGVVSFSSGAVTNFPVTVVDEQARQGAYFAIALMTAEGATNIGGGLLQGLSEITDSERVDEEVVVLISDGEHTTGTPPEQAKPLLVAEGVKVHTIGIGEAIPTELLLTLAAATGGSSAFPKDNFGMVESMSRLSLSAEGHHPILTTDGTLGPGQAQPVEVLVDETNDQLVVVQQWTNGGMELTLTDPDDVVIDATTAATDPDVHYVAGWTAAFYRVQNPTPGTWTLTTKAADTNLLPSQYGLQIYDRSDSILVSAEAPPAATDYPAPFLVATNVSVGSQQVVGANVTAEVTRPDGSVVTVTLHDDGQDGHGDQTANDGTYSQLFGQYAGSGVYNVKVIVENDAGVTGPGEFMIDELPEPQAVLAFRRESHVSVNVENAPDEVTLGTIDVGAPDTQLEDATIVAGILRQQTVLAFRLSAGEGEYVELSELPIRTTTSDGTAAIHHARLFLDSDGDGFVDHDSEWTTPVAEVAAADEDGTVVFRDVRVPAGTDAQFLVTYEVVPGPVNQDPGAAPPSSGADEPGGEADEQGVPLTLLTLLATGLLGLALRRRRQVVFGGALAAAIAMAGCSMQADDETEPLPVIVTGPSATVSHSTTVQTLLVVADVAAEGVTSGTELTVTGSDVIGPTITVTN